MRITCTILAVAATAAMVAADQTITAQPTPAQPTPAQPSPENPNDDYISQVCAPTNSSGFPDMDAPCNQFGAVQLQCIYGTYVGLEIYIQGDIYTDDDDDGPQMQDNRTQQICACESNLFGLLDACVACERDHGGNEIIAFLDPSIVASASSSYCVASATPTVGIDLAVYFLAQPSALPPSVQSAYSAAQTSSFSDPIGNYTAASYYYTASVTGSAAYVVAEATGPQGTTGIGSFATIKTSNGQIVPTITQGAMAQTSGGSSGASTTSPTGTGSHKTTGTTSPSTGMGSRATAGVMGVMGLVGVVAML